MQSIIFIVSLLNLYFKSRTGTLKSSSLTIASCESNSSSSDISGNSCTFSSSLFSSVTTPFFFLAAVDCLFPMANYTMNNCTLNTNQLSILSTIVKCNTVFC
eukprot:484269_1